MTAILDTAYVTTCVHCSTRYIANPPLRLACPRCEEAGHAGPSWGCEVCEQARATAKHGLAQALAAQEGD